MPKITMQVNELSDAQPTRVSLVKHAANRTPFRIMKEDKEMGIDLSGAFSAVRGALARKSDGTKIAAIVVRKDYDISAVQPKLEKLGLSFATKSEKDGLVMYVQPGVTMGERTGVLKFDDNTALMISNLHSIRSQVPVKKDFDSWSITSTTFMEALNTDGFYPSIGISMDALRCCIFNIMEDAESTDDASGMIDAAIDEFKAWIMACVRGIPTKAFKAEAAYGGPERAALAGTMPTQTGVQAAAAVGQLGATTPDDLQKRQTDGQAGTAELTTTIVAKIDPSIGTDLVPEKSAVNDSQGTARVDGSGGKNPQVVGNAAEAPLGTDVKTDPAPAEDKQRTDELTGAGGKLPAVAGTGASPQGTGTRPEPSFVNASQSPGAQATGHGGDNTAAVLKAELAALLGPLTASIATLTTRVAKAEEAIGGTVLGGANDDPVDTRQARAKKSDAAPPFLDTGFDRSHLNGRGNRHH